MISVKQFCNHMEGAFLSFSVKAHALVMHRTLAGIVVPNIHSQI